MNPLELNLGNKIYRSSSYGDVLGDSDSDRKPHSSTEITRSIINSQPQDFVIVNGQPYKVSRSPRPPLNHTEDTDSFISFKEFWSDISTKSYEDLAHELYEARKLIHKQEHEIKKLKYGKPTQMFEPNGHNEAAYGAKGISSSFFFLNLLSIFFLYQSC
jgi:hypothetical protein